MKRLIASSILVAAAAALPSVAFSLTDQEKAAATANWTQHCARCHAADGSAATKLGKTMKLKDYTKAADQAKFTDAEAFDAIKNGVKDESGKMKMNPYSEKLSDEEIKVLVAYTRTLVK